MTITFCIKDASPLDVDKYSSIMTMDLSKSTSYPITFSTEKREQISNRNVKTITVTKKYFHTISWDNCMITKQKEANTGGWDETKRQTRRNPIRSIGRSAHHRSSHDYASFCYYDCRLSLINRPRIKILLRWCKGQPLFFFFRCEDYSAAYNCSTVTIV